MSDTNRSILSNAGRCDICGNTVDMRDDGDTLSIVEFGDLREEIKNEHGLTDQDAIEAVANAMETVAESGAGLDLAQVIREDGSIKVHKSCLSKTNYSMLEKGK
jgi:hypothetical protein